MESISLYRYFCAFYMDFGRVRQEKLLGVATWLSEENV